MARIFLKSLKQGLLPFRTRLLLLNKTFCLQSPFHTKRKHFKLRANVLSSQSCKLVDVKVRATKIMQLVLQHCCKTSWIAILGVLAPTSNLSSTNQVVDRFERGWKNPQHTPFHSFCSNVAKQVAHFCCLFYRSFRACLKGGGGSLVGEITRGGSPYL